MMSLGYGQRFRGCKIISGGLGKLVGPSVDAGEQIDPGQQAERAMAFSQDGAGELREDRGRGPNRQAGCREGPRARQGAPVPFLTGAFTPLVTPFKSGAVDYDRYAQLIEWQIEQGTHGLLVNATSGEPTTLTVDEKARLIEVAVKTSAARKPVVAGIPSNRTLMR